MPEVADLLTPALLIALFTWLRNDIRKLHDRVDRVEDRLGARIDETTRRIDGLAREMAELRERMARLEGALEGFLAGFRDRNGARDVGIRDRDGK